MELLHKGDVLVEEDTATLGAEKIMLSDIKHVVFNTDTVENDDISAAALIKLRSRDNYSLMSGLDRYRKLQLVFAEDAKPEVKKLLAAMYKRKIPVKTTNLMHNTFMKVFLPS